MTYILRFSKNHVNLSNIAVSTLQEINIAQYITTTSITVTCLMFDPNPHIINMRVTNSEY